MFPMGILAYFVAILVHFIHKVTFNWNIIPLRCLFIYHFIENDHSYFKNIISLKGFSYHLISIHGACITCDLLIGIDWID